MQSTVRFEARGNVNVQTQTQAGGVVVVQPPPPPPPAPIVAIQNAPVVEFFGIPLEGVQDVVFVLDCSGSMAAGVPHRLAEYQVPADTPPPASPPPDAFTPPPPAGPPPDGGPPPEPMPPAATPPPSSEPVPVADPNAPPPMVTRTRQLSKLEVAIAELVDAVSRLPAGTRMNILFFNNDLDAYAPSLVPLEDAARDGLIQFVRASQPDGGTALAPALRLSYMLNAKRVVLLSDGLGNIGGDAEAVLRDAREAMRGGLRIDAVGVGNDQDGAMLDALAKESGGLYQPL